MIKIILPVISILLFTGCSSTEKPKPLTVSQKQINYYNKAYVHGCSTQKGEYKKNIRRYVKDEYYRKGWNEGYFHCGEKRLDNTYPFDREAYKDGYRTAATGINIIKYRNESYRQSWIKGYYAYQNQ